LQSTRGERQTNGGDSMSIGQVNIVNGTSPKTIKLEAAAARTRGDVVRIGVGGSTGANVDITLADDTNIYTVAVCNENAATGDVYEAIVQGTTVMTVTSDTYTVGNGVHLLNGTVLNSDAAAEAPTGISTLNDFGVVLVGGTAVTEITATLYGDAVTAQT